MNMKLRYILSSAALAVLRMLSGCGKTRPEVFVPGSSQKPGDSGETPSPGGDTPSPAAEFDYSRLTEQNHPRVIFTQSDFDAILSAASSDKVLSTVHSAVITIANQSLTKAVPVYKLDGKRLLSVSRDSELRLLSCAYAYRTTRDSRYLTCAEKTLEAVCSFQDWNARKHFLDVGEMAAGVGLAYDWLYADLTSELNVKIEKALVDLAFTPAQNKVWNLDFYNSTSNWNQVCNGGLVCAALAVYEKNTSVAKSIIEKAVESNAKAVAEMYSPDGNYPEGYSYWNYGTLYQALMNTAFETAGASDFGLSSLEGFSKTSRYMMNMEGPVKNCFNYSDSAPSVNPCIAQFYFAWKFKDVSLLYMEKNRLQSYQSCSENRLLPLIAWYAYKMKIGSSDSIPAPEEKVYSGQGITPVVLVHGNWKMDNSDKFLGIKGGKGNTSHAHLDAGSFVFDAEGVRWAADIGLQSYSTLEPYINLWDMNDGSQRWTSVRYNNFKHDTLTVNDAYHKAAGEAVVESVINSDGKAGAILNLSAPLAGEVESARRTIYLQGEDLIVRDEIKALSSKDAQVRWMMISKASPEIEYGAITLKSSTGKYRYLKTSSATLHRPTLKCSVGAADGTAWSLVSSNYFDQSNSGYYKAGYELTVKAGTSATVEVRLTPEE